VYYSATAMIKPTIFFSFLLLCFASLDAQIPERGSVTDIDGNVYQTVIIGRYEWMAANLKTTAYNNGTKIPKITGDTAWSRLSSDAYCYYNDNESKADTCGALYNWYAVNTGNLCPDGWRVPTDDEWKFLEGCADSRYGPGDSVWDNRGLRGYDAGQRLKSTSGWRSGYNGTEAIGFTALPCGEHLSSGRYFIAGSNGFWWSSSGCGTTIAWYRSIIYAFEDVMRNFHDKRFGFSVRCLRNLNAGNGNTN